MLKVANSVISASRITGVLPVANGGTGVTTSTGTGNTVLSASPTLSGDVTLSTGNLVQGITAKGITTGGAFNLGLGANNSVAQANLTPSGNFLLNSTSFPYLYAETSNAKGVLSLNNDHGKSLAGSVTNVAASGTADFDVSYFAFGFLVVNNERATDAGQRTTTTFSVFSRGGTNFTCTAITSVDGTAAASFTVTWVGDTTIRVTNTSANATNVTMAYFGL